ncbi:MAG: DUF1501 domain-containing protein [Verrucomicrobiota bacterium]
MKELLDRSPEVTRRDFARFAAGSFLGLSMLPEIKAQAAAAKAKNCIYLFMSGGMSHMETLDPKPEADGRGLTQTIKTNVPGIQLGQYLPSLARHMDKCAIVRSINSTQGAHLQGRYFMHTSYAMRGTIVHPSLGAWVNKLSDRSRDIPDFVKMGGSNKVSGVGFFESKYSPLPVNNPGNGLDNSSLHKDLTQERFDRRLDLSNQLDQAYRERYDRKDVRSYTDMYSDAIRLMQSKDLEVFDLSKESDFTRKSYGDDRLGRACLLARRLVENDVRFIQIHDGEWDHHGNIYDRLPDKAGALDRVLSALLDDLAARGLLDSTLVVLATEFGRTPVINGRGGRNHYPKAFSCLLAGGGIQGGQVYGATDKHGREIIENKVSVPDFNATIAHQMGMPLDLTLFSPSMRPFQIAHHGKPILDLV